MTLHPNRPGSVASVSEITRVVRFSDRDAVETPTEALLLLKRKVKEYDDLEVSDPIEWRNDVGALPLNLRRMFQGAGMDRARTRYAVYGNTRSLIESYTTKLDESQDWVPTSVTALGVSLIPNRGVTGVGTAGFTVADDADGTPVGTDAQSLTNTTVANQPAVVDAGNGVEVLDFDTTDYLDIGNGTSADIAFSVMGWIGFWAKCDEIPAAGAANNQFIYAHTSTTNLRTLLFTSSTDSMVFRYSTSAGADVATFGVASYGEPPDLNWHWHELFYNGGGTGDAGRVQQWKDDVLKTSTFTATVPATLPNPSVTPLIGAGALRNGSLSFKGKLGTFHVISGAHPTAEERYRLKAYDAPIRVV